MKTSSALFLAILALTGTQSAFAMRESEPRFRREMNVQSEPEIVKWIGEIRDEPSTHTTKHDHELSFTKNEDGKSFDIVDSPELVQLHHETEKNFLVEIEAEKTPRFLFWGGNLIVKSFRVIRELSGPIDHAEPARKVMPQNGGGRRS